MLERPRRTFLFPLAGALVTLLSSGCSDKDANRFLDALKRGDYEAAHAELHSEARAVTPNGGAIKASMDAAGITLDDWFATCSSADFSTKRVGYNDTTRRRGTGAHPPVIVGVPPVRRGKCNTSLVVDLKKDDALPGRPWKIVGMKLE
jgi:hypothetical protein